MKRLNTYFDDYEDMICIELLYFTKVGNIDYLTSLVS